MSRVLKLAVIPGDGIGPEVIAEAEKVLDASTAGSGIRFEKTRFSLGAARFLETGDTLTDADLEAIAGQDEHRPVPCHDDLLTANFLHDGERVQIIDWEYAGMGDRYFDLGNLAVNNQLDDDQESALLEAYFGELRQWDVEPSATGAADNVVATVKQLDDAPRFQRP